MKKISIKNYLLKQKSIGNNWKAMIENFGSVKNKQFYQKFLNYFDENNLIIDYCLNDKYLQDDNTEYSESEIIKLLNNFKTKQ